MMRKKLLFFLFFTIFLSSYEKGYSQVRNIMGTVRDSLTGSPLAGVAIHVPNASGKSSVTNELGQFSITVSLSNTLLAFELTGYNMHIKYIPSGDTMRVLLIPVNKALEEVVVVGYGTQKKLNLTGAVTQVSGSVLENRASPNITQGLQGMVPNLNLVMGDGKPTQSPSYNVRGTTSIGQGGSALVLIDGVQGDPSLLNPNDVASVSVLKDAASASIYGARAAFGVVLITTKNPKKERVTLTYSSSYSYKKPTVVPDVVSNGYQYALMFDSAWSAWNDYSQVPQNINKTQPFSQAYLAEYKRRNDDPSLPKVDYDANGNYVYYGNTNWYDLLYKNRVGAIDQNLSLSGSSAKASYYVTGRYYGQDGLFRYNSDDYKMYNLMAKGNIQLLPWLQVYNNTQYTYRFYHNPLNVGEGGSIWRNLADEGHPSSMLQNPDGTLTFSSAYTVGDFFYGKNGIDMNSYVLRNTTGFNANILKNELRIRGDFTFQTTRNDQKRLRVQVPYSTKPGSVAYVGTSYNDINMTQQKNNYIATNLYAEYERHLNRDHYVKVLAGINYEQSTYDTLSVTRNGLIYSDADNLNLALGQSITTGDNYEKWAIFGGFARVNYAFRDKYLLEANGRYDGSSKFPSNQRYGFFPSVSAGWRVSNESFWKVSPSIITDLKIRASYGSLGNGNIASYSFQEIFNIQQSGRVINGVLPQYTSAPGVVPSGLTWETATSKNLGLDLLMLNGRLSITGDIYRRNTKNMFTVGPTQPGVFGATVPKGNYADMYTQGWEASISYNNQFDIAKKPFHYTVAVWMSDYSATITKYNNLTKKLTDYYSGQKVGEIWGYVNDGYWTADNVGQAKTMQALFKSSNSGTWLPGDIKFKDLNGDGAINNGDNTATNPGDMKVIGNSTPRYPFGINLSGDYSNFFFSVFFQGVLKQNWWPGAESDVFWGQYNRPYNYIFQSQVNKIWSESNPDSYFPRYRGYIAQNGSGTLNQKQTKYLQDVKYIRLKNLQIGYNISRDVLQKIHLQGVRVYVSGENLWSASPLYKNTKAMDVESIQGSDRVLTDGSNGNGNNYPILKSYTIGLVVNL